VQDLEGKRVGKHVASEVTLALAGLRIDSRGHRAGRDAQPRADEVYSGELHGATRIRRRNAGHVRKRRSPLALTFVDRIAPWPASLARKNEQFLDEDRVIVRYADILSGMRTYVHHVATSLSFIASSRLGPYDLATCGRRLRLPRGDAQRDLRRLVFEPALDSIERL
jgi:hypothetical protein